MQRAFRNIDGLCCFTDHASQEEGEGEGEGEGSRLPLREYPISVLEQILGCYGGFRPSTPRNSSPHTHTRLVSGKHAQAC